MPNDMYVPFSIRAGRRSSPELGLQDMPHELRVSLWNVIEPWIWVTAYGDEYARRARWIFNFHAIRWTTDSIPSEANKREATTRLCRWFLTDATADDVYDFVEALPQMVYVGLNGDISDIGELAKRSLDLHIYAQQTIERYLRDANRMLEREGSPYRIIDGLLSPITSDEEIAEVRAALSQGDRFAPARDHIAQGLEHLGDRPPSYADCVKQAISAVESALKIAVGDGSRQMPQLLKGFDEKYGALHPALRTAIDKLYGYASDEHGVRHGATGPVSVGEAEARAMLVMCSALTNFLVRKASG